MTEEKEIADLKDKLLRTLADMENYGVIAKIVKTPWYSLATLREICCLSRQSAPGNRGRSPKKPIRTAPLWLDLSKVRTDREGAAVDAGAPWHREDRSMGEKPQFHGRCSRSRPSTRRRHAQVVEVGRVIHDRLLRPAKVGIAKAGSAPAGQRPIDTDWGQANIPCSLICIGPGLVN